MNELWVGKEELPNRVGWKHLLATLTDEADWLMHRTRCEVIRSPGQVSFCRGRQLWLKDMLCLR